MHESLNEITLQQACELYRSHPRRLRGSLRPATISDIEYTLLRYAAPFWDRPIASISSEECTRLFEQLTHVAPRVASKTMGYLRTMINMARRYYRDEDTVVPIQAANPVTLMMHKTPLNRLQVRHGLIPKARVHAVWQALTELGDRGTNSATRTAADWLRWRLMTGMRPAESCALRFSNVDWQRNVIEVPATLTKNHRTHLLPMTPQMRELLAHRRDVSLAAHPGNETAPDMYIFASEASATGHIMSARATLKAVAGKDITEFDIRRTFVAIAWECGIDPDVMRHVLNHKVSPQFRRFNNSLEPMRDALVRIARWLYQIPANRQLH